MKTCKACDTFKAVLITVGAVICVGALIYAAYTLFKKYFTVTFECDGNCDCCDADCFKDECESENSEDSCEPICCCEEE